MVVGSKWSVIISICLPSELASDGLKGRVFEVSLADLQNDEVAFRKFRLISEDIQGKNVLTNFHGMTMTTDKLRSLVKKWQVSSVPYSSAGWGETKGVEAKRVEAKGVEAKGVEAKVVRPGGWRPRG